MDDLHNSMKKIAKDCQAASKAYEQQNDNWWNNLTEEERELAFYAVCKRLHQAEVVEQRSFRGTLYGVFGFGPHMYGTAMDCGFMSLHNAIFDGGEFMSISGAKELEVKDNGHSVRWTDINSLAIDKNNQRVTITLNQGNNYV